MVVTFSVKAGVIDEKYKKAQQYFYAKKFSIASQLLKTILSQKPDHGEALSLMGDVFLMNQKYNDAIVYYNQAKEVKSNVYIEEYRLGQVYTELQKPQKAIYHFVAAYQKNNKLHISLYQCGYVSLVQLRDKEKTINYWQEFILKAPDDPQRPKIERVIALLRDVNFKLPDKNSDISIEEVLLLGGQTIASQKLNPHDKQAGHEKDKTNNNNQGLLDDDEL